MPSVLPLIACRLGNASMQAEVFQSLLFKVLCSAAPHTSSCSGRCCGGLQKLYIGHHTGALRLSNSTSSSSSSSPRSTSSSEGLDRLEAACSSRGTRAQLLRRNPNIDGGYEARTLRQVLF